MKLGVPVAPAVVTALTPTPKDARARGSERSPSQSRARRRPCGRAGDATQQRPRQHPHPLSDPYNSSIDRQTPARVETAHPLAPISRHDLGPGKNRRGIPATAVLAWFCGQPLALAPLARERRNSPTTSTSVSTGYVARSTAGRIVGKSTSDRQGHPPMGLRRPWAARGARAPALAARHPCADRGSA